MTTALPPLEGEFTSLGGMPFVRRDASCGPPPSTARRGAGLAAALPPRLATDVPEELQHRVRGEVGGDAGPHVERRVGHVSLDTTHRYAEITVQMKAQALEACEPPVAASTGPHRTGRWRHDESLLKWLRSL